MVKWSIHICVCVCFYDLLCIIKHKQLSEIFSKHLPRAWCICLCYSWGVSYATCVPAPGGSLVATSFGVHNLLSGSPRGHDL